MKRREIGTSNDNQDRMKLMQFLEDLWDVDRWQLSNPNEAFNKLFEWQKQLTK